MTTLEKVRKLLYDDVNGVFIGIRDDHFAVLTDEVMAAVLDYVQVFCEEAKSGKMNRQGFVMLMDVLSTIHNAVDYLDEQQKDRYNRFYDDLIFELIKGMPDQ